jgi:hypothetical protein
MRARLPSRLRPGGAALSALLVALVALLVAPAARAQVHWDVGAQAGVIKRFTTGGANGAPDPGFGPVVQLQGHLALVPMVRIGLYAAADVSPASGVGARTFYEGGLHLKVTPPLLSAPWRAWAFAGFGYAYTYAASFHAPVALPTSTTNVLFGGTYGGMLDVPLGLGLGYKPARAGVPWLVFAELGGRLGVGFYGPMYDDGAAGTAGGVVTVAPFLGKDSFALTLSVGLSLEQ